MQPLERQTLHFLLNITKESAKNAIGLTVEQLQNIGNSNAISDNLPNSIESLFVFGDGQVPDNLPPDDSCPDSDSHFDDACVVDPFSPFSEDRNGDLW
jgi:hypothetical protein